MASNFRSIEDSTNCSICLGRFKQPVILVCGHVFCQTCITHYSHTTAGSKSCFPCPLCRSSIKITATGFEEKDRNCELCETTEEATFYCTECLQPLCTSCQQVHGKLKSSRHHPVINIQGSQSTLVNDKAKFCTEHPSERISMYCEDCSVGVCSKCFVRKHNGHKFIDVEENGSLQSSITELQMLQKGLEKQLRRHLEFSDSLIKINGAVREIADIECAEVDDQIQRICEELRDVGENIKRRIRKIRDVERINVEKVKGEHQVLTSEIIDCMDKASRAIDDVSIMNMLQCIPEVREAKLVGEARQLDLPVVRALKFIKGTSYPGEDVLGSTVLERREFNMDTSKITIGFRVKELFERYEISRSMDPWLLTINKHGSVSLSLSPKSDLKSCEVEFDVKLRNFKNDGEVDVTKGRDGIRGGEWVLLARKEVWGENEVVNSDYEGHVEVTLRVTNKRIITRGANNRAVVITTDNMASVMCLE